MKRKNLPPKGNFDKYVFTKEDFRNRKPIYLNDSPYGITSYSIFRTKSDDTIAYIVHSGDLWSLIDGELQLIKDKKWTIHLGILYIEKQDNFNIKEI